MCSGQGVVNEGFIRLDGRERRALRPHAQGFDEVRIKTVPRYKTSGMSGDEWRISAQVEFFHKGKVVYTTRAGDVTRACQILDRLYDEAVENVAITLAGHDGFCDQEGCSEPWIVVYKLKNEFCDRGHKTDPYQYDKTPLIRKFCLAHSTRGDCGLEDADRNYEKVTGAPVAPPAEAIHPATQVTVQVGNLDELPAKIDEAITKAKGGQS